MNFKEREKLKMAVVSSVPEGTVTFISENGISQHLRTNNWDSISSVTVLAAPYEMEQSI